MKLSSIIDNSSRHEEECDTDSDGWDLDLEAFMTIEESSSTAGKKRDRDPQIHSQEQSQSQQRMKRSPGSFTCIPLGNINSGGQEHEHDHGQNSNMVHNYTPSPCTDHSSGSSSSNRSALNTLTHHPCSAAAIGSSPPPLILLPGSDSDTDIGNELLPPWPRPRAQQPHPPLSLSLLTEEEGGGGEGGGGPRGSADSVLIESSSSSSSSSSSLSACCTEDVRQPPEVRHGGGEESALTSGLDLEALHDCGSMSTITLTDELLGNESGQAAAGPNPASLGSKPTVGLTKHSLGSMCILFSNNTPGGNGGGGGNDADDESAGGGKSNSAPEAKLIANIVKRRKSGTELHDAHTTHTASQSQSQSQSTASSNSSSSSISNALKSEGVDYNWPRGPTSPQELCRLQHLVPRSMREWSSLLSHCSIISREISSSSNKSSSGDCASATFMTPRSEKALLLVQTLRAMYANLDRVSVALGAEALLQMYVKEKMAQTL